MKLRVSPRTWSLLLALATAATLQAALAAGGIAFTKRLETKLLAEPNPMAAVSAKVGYAKQLKVEEARGSWLRVSESANSGWVFAGNVSDTKIEENTPALKLSLTASATTADAATRGLTDEAKAYASSHKLADASGDLTWLLEQSEGVTPEDVEKFLQEQKRGEFK